MIQSAHQRAHLAARHGFVGCMVTLSDCPTGCLQELLEDDLSRQLPAANTSNSTTMSNLLQAVAMITKLNKAITGGEQSNQQLLQLCQQFLQAASPALVYQGSQLPVAMQCLRALEQITQALKHQPPACLVHQQHLQGLLYNPPRGSDR